jgi:hypothetical protein
MKRKDDWRNKLDPWALEFLEGYRKASAERGMGDPAKWHEKMEEIAAKHPQIRELGKVEVLPEFVDRLLQNEELAKHLSVFNPSPGTKTMNAPVARFINVAQIVTLALDDPQMRVFAGLGIGVVAQIFGSFYSDISKMWRLLQLIGAARSRTSIRFRYMCEFALRPQAVTWKEFRLLYEKWSADRRPSVLSEWMSRHAKARSVSQEDVEVELFDAITGKRATLLSAAAESKSVEEQDSQLVESGALLQMMEQLLRDLGKLTPQRFGKLFDQCSHWIGFRKNKADLQQRQLEEKLMLKLLSSASAEQSVGIYEQVLPDRWDFDIGDGTLPMRKALRAKCEKLVAPKASEEAIGFMAREGAIHSLTEQGRFTGVKHCLFQRRSPVWTSKLRNKLLATIRKGRTDPTIYLNVRDFFDLIVYGLERGVDSVGPRDVSNLLSDYKFVSTLWHTVTSRKIQYRLQMTFIQARQSLIKAGASESALLLPEELQSRLDEEASKQKAKMGDASLAVPDSEDSSLAQPLESESQT